MWETPKILFPLLFSNLDILNWNFWPQLLALSTFQDEGRNYVFCASCDFLVFALT